MKVSIFAFYLFFILSCRHDQPLKLPTFDGEAFKKDRGGCLAQRSGWQAFLETHKKVFLGATENQIFSTLGRYDYQILDKKNEKTFVYFLEKGSHCLHIQSPSLAKCMVIKFNSVSLVKEVIFNQGNPD
jgi:hypothetical protein